jgi:hypothetical protein
MSDGKQKTRFETTRCFSCLRILFRVEDTLFRNTNRNTTWRNAKYRGADNYSKHAKAQWKACFALKQYWLSVGALCDTDPDVTIRHRSKYHSPKKPAYNGVPESSWTRSARRRSCHRRRMSIQSLLWVPVRHSAGECLRQVAGNNHLFFWYMCLGNSDKDFVGYHPNGSNIIMVVRR